MDKKKKDDSDPRIPPVQVDQFLLDLDNAAPGSVPPADDEDGGSKKNVHLGSDAISISPDSRGPLSQLFNGNYLSYASYVICSRAVPTIEDGLKPVQRRIMHALWEKDDGRFIKVANIVGHTMQYHPHGDQSIAGALVALVNKRYLIQGQGNFGSLLTGDSAAAARYIECRLTNLARKEIFNPKTTTYIPSYDGRNQEPVLLPSKLPLLLMLGAEGIAVGLSTDVLSHNFIELLEAEICILQKKPFVLHPDFITSGLMDPSEYNDGRGRVKVRAIVENRPKEKNKLFITGLPFGQTTEKLIASIEKAINGKKLQIRQINDLTAKDVEIELVLSPGADPDKTIKSLYAFTDCECSVNSHIIVLKNNRPIETTVSEILRTNVDQLVALIKLELEIRLSELENEVHNRTLERIFIEERIYKKIEQMTTAEAIAGAVRDGFKAFEKELVRPLAEEDIEHLLQIRIRRISLFDINKNRQEIAAIRKEETEIADSLGNLKRTAISYLKNLIKQYKDEYPRLTQITTFKETDLRTLTASELSILHNKEDGYLGHDIKNGEELFKCSSLDRLLLVWSDGRYKVMPPPDKFFVDKDLLHCALYNREKEYTLLYTEPDYGFTYIKRFTFGGAIFNKEYRLSPERSDVRLFQEGCPETVYVKYKPVKNQRINQQTFSPSEVTVRSASSKGIQMTSKELARIDTTKPRWWDDSEKSPRGVLS